MSVCDCKSCRDGEAKAFLAKLKDILAEMDGPAASMSTIAVGYMVSGLVSVKKATRRCASTTR